MKAKSTDASNHVYYYIYNLQGDVIAIADAVTGGIVGTYSYDAWGKCTVGAGSSNIATLNPFRYRGYYYDSDTGLYYLNSRYYDAETGRFINADAFATTDVGGVLSANMFAYCENNPVMRSDPTGEWVHIVVGALIGGASAAIDGLADQKNGWAMVRTIGIGIVSGALSAVIPSAGFLIDTAASAIDSTIDIYTANGNYSQEIATGASSLAFDAVSSSQESFLTSSQFSETIKGAADAYSKTKPGNHPNAKSAARSFINRAKRTTVRKAAREVGTQGGISILKNGFNRLLKLIF